VVKLTSVSMQLSRHDVADLDGGCNPVKVLMSSRCLHDCGYCPNSTSSGGSGGKRHGPEEVVNRFLEMRQEGFSGGLFLSSGVERDAEATQELLVETAELAREKWYTGYLHVKVMPGAPRHLVERCGEVADRLSVNVETVPGRMDELSSTKDYGIDVERRLRWASEQGTPSGATSQIIAGGAGETDRDLFDHARGLYEQFELERVYYSGFRPILGTPMEGRKAAGPRREARLYRAGWLHRIYGFTEEEMDEAFVNRTLARDPKVRIAERTDVSIDPDEATEEELLRVPGIGPRRAEDLANGGDASIPRRARPYLEGQSRLSDYG